jgi:hypothetical protein
MNSDDFMKFMSTYNLKCELFVEKNRIQIKTAHVIYVHNRVFDAVSWFLAETPPIPCLLMN